MNKAAVNPISFLQLNGDAALARGFLNELTAKGVTTQQKGKTLAFFQHEREVSGNALNALARDFLITQKKDSRQRYTHFLIKNAIGAALVDNPIVEPAVEMQPAG